VRRALLGLLLLACGQVAPAALGPADAGDDVVYGVVPADAGRIDASDDDANTKTPWNRMEPHRGEVLPSMRLEIVYIGLEGVDGARNQDDFIRWLVGSDYWGLMKQYGVGPGSMLGSMRVATEEVLPAGSVDGGLIAAESLDARIYQMTLCRGPADPPDAAADAADAGSDAGHACFPAADAYVFFLPNGVNVSLGNRGTHTFQTCLEADGYHYFDGIEPYAIIPPCSLGRSPLTMSHELAEMATDPFPGDGWFSDADQQNSGGEIGDLCNQTVAKAINGYYVTQLWSNADGDCEPN
jgi:hypothetical protein